MMRGMAIKTGVVFAIALFAFASLFGVFHMLNMGSDGMMNGCPFAPGSSICAMTPLEHAGAALNYLAATPQENAVLVFFLVFVSVILALARVFFLEGSPPRLLSY